MSVEEHELVERLPVIQRGSEFASGDALLAISYGQIRTIALYEDLEPKSKKPVSPVPHKRERKGKASAGEKKAILGELPGLAPFPPDIEEKKL